MAFGSPQTITASTAKTASGNSGVMGLAAELGSTLSVMVDVSAVSGTSPTLDLKVQWSMDGTTMADAEPVDSLAQITAAKKVFKSVTVKAPFYRLSWTIAGTTPSFTFSAVGFVTS